MAFNPFNAFRRHSKVVFAGLVLVAMFTFVLSSGMGRGDMFTQLTDWATRRGSRATVLTVYGQEFDAPAVAEIRYRRQLANTYMDLAVAMTQEAVLGRVQTGLEKLDPAMRSTVQRLVQMKFLAMRIGGQFLDEYRNNIVRNAALYAQFLNQFIEQAERDKDKKPEALATLAGIRNLLNQDYLMMERGPGELYFGGRADERDPNAIADFLIWRHQADQLGVRFTDADVNALVAVETMNELTGEMAARIDRILRDQYRQFYNRDSLTVALGDEFRVRMARAAITGETLRTKSGPPDALTPDQLWDLFRDARTTLKVGLIEINTDSFLPLVTGTPSEEELKKLFDKYKNVEPAPFRAEPGFKELRRIQVAWVGATPTLPYYEKLATQVGPVLPYLRLLGDTVPPALLGAPLSVSAELLYQEQDYRRRELPWTDNFTPRLHDTSVLRPENVAALLGTAAGAFASGGTALSGPLALESQAIVREVRDRVEFGGAVLLTAALPGMPLGALGLPAVATQHVALTTLRGSLQEKARTELARRLMDADLTAFRGEVTKLGKERDKTAVKKYVEQFVKDRGLMHGTTSELRDFYNLPDDPGLSPLKQAYARGHGVQDPLLRNFASEFFAEASAMNEPGGIYVPRTFFTGSSDGTQYLYWTTEDISSRTQQFAKAKPQVIEAWKRLKAQEMAKNEAERLADLAKKAEGDPQKLRDIAAQHGGREYFELGPMARYLPQSSPLAGQGRRYEPYRIPQDKVTYPSDEMLTKVLDLRKQEKGATTVVADLPQKHYYAAGLLQREEPTQEEFRKAYVNSMARAVEYDSFLAMLAGDRRAQFRKDLLEYLRAQAKVVVNDEAMRRGPERQQPISED